MDWRDDLAAGLPSPNADEPTSLRQDILDELADHLACAAQRIALRAELDQDEDSLDEQDIAERVLERFGDPARIARRLWFDAMKGKLMMQKLTTTFAAVAACAAIAGCVLIWSALESTKTALATAIDENRQDRLAAEKAGREDRLAAEKANRALLAQLAKLETGARKPPRSLEWNPLKFKLLAGVEGENPAAGYSVTITGQPYMAGKEQSVTKKSDSQGMVDFGLVRPGSYSVNLATPWNAAKYHSLLVQPGTEVVRTIRCPATPVADAKLQLQTNLPDDLVKRNCIVAIEFSRPRQKSANDDEWSLNHDFDWVLLPGKPNEKVRSSSALRDFPSIVRSPGPRTAFLLGNADMSWTDGDPKPLKWVNATYRIMSIAILQPSDYQISRSVPFNNRYRNSKRFEIVDYAVFGNHYQVPPAAIYVEKAPTFTPQPGVDNVWKITLPPQMIENARTRLKSLDEQQTRNTTPQPTLEEFVKQHKPTETEFDKLSEPDKLAYAKIIRSYFQFMDRNRDGWLNEDEWTASARIKPVFLNAKIDLKKEMNETAFRWNYIKLLGLDDPTWKRTLEKRKNNSPKSE